MPKIRYKAEGACYGGCLAAQEAITLNVNGRNDGASRCAVMPGVLGTLLFAIFLAIGLAPVNHLAAEEQEIPKYWLSIESGEHGTVLDESGWFNAGDCVVITAVPDPYWHLDHWEGDVDPENATGNPLIVIMDSDKAVRAVFAPNVTENTGTPEEWLARLGYEADFESAALDDLDSDGMCNAAEYAAGTDPADRESALIVFLEKATEAGAGRNGSGVPSTEVPVIKWTSTEGRLYRVEATDDLPGGKFTALAGAERIEATPPVNMFVDTSATTALARFYRVVAYCP